MASRSDWIIPTVRSKLIAGIYRLRDGWYLPTADMDPEQLRDWKVTVEMFREYFILGRPITQIARERKCSRQNISRRLINFWAKLKRLGRVEDREEAA